MKLLKTDTPPPAIANNYVEVTVDSVNVTEAGKIQVRLRVPVIEFEFSAVTDILVPGQVIRLTAWGPAS